ncbi:hypothetical protein X805_34620 [Sphaerotilus natans subsp. natans DSM 6575]|uniref:Uncharacterized protein n=1 Tax=Sphaerotilus natans subsp. natans DSM 6575 TaxID=1286631 RepID=A0A059KHP0_9BURK|nr:hypothetical protein X805_34620 [Sphaerotilus natans subsp. natans DSM 6575]
MHRKAVQVGQAGVACAEVVDRQAHAHGAQLGQPARGLVLVADQHRLGQLQLQALGRQATAGQGAANLLRKVRHPELDRGHIDRHHQIRPGQRLTTGFVEHPLPQGPDQAAFLGHRDESVRTDLRRLGARAPAQQRLHRHDPTTGQAALRLVQQREPARQRLERLMQGGANALVLGQARQHRRREQAGLAPTGTLGFIERGVGMAHQQLGAATVLRRAGHPDRHGRRNDPPVQVEGLLDMPGQLGGQMQRVLARRTRLRDHHHELVTGEPAHHAPVPDLVREPPGHRAQQLIAQGMTVGVVDLLEAIEVHAEHAHTRSGSARLGRAQGLLQLLDALHPVGQAGQRIVQGQELELQMAATAVDLPADGTDVQCTEHRHVIDPGQGLEQVRCDGQPAVAVHQQQVALHADEAQRQADLDGTQLGPHERTTPDRQRPEQHAEHHQQVDGPERLGIVVDHRHGQRAQHRQHAGQQQRTAPAFAVAQPQQPQRGQGEQQAGQRPRQGDQRKQPVTVVTQQMSPELPPERRVEDSHRQHPAAQQAEARPSRRQHQQAQDCRRGDRDRLEQHRAGLVLPVEGLRPRLHDRRGHIAVLKPQKQAHRLAGSQRQWQHQIGSGERGQRLRPLQPPLLLLQDLAGGRIEHLHLQIRDAPASHHDQPVLRLRRRIREQAGQPDGGVLPEPVTLRQRGRTPPGLTQHGGICRNRCSRLLQHLHRLGQIEAVVRPGRKIDRGGRQRRH